LNVTRFIIGLLLTITGGTIFLGWVNELGWSNLFFIVMAILGVVLISASGFEGRLLIGILILVGDAVLWSMAGNYPSNWIAYISIAIVGFVLIYSGARELLDIVRMSASRRDGHEGTVRNLMKEGDLTSFWLDGSGKDGTPVRVEGTIREGLIVEGENIWVRGHPSEKGIIRIGEFRRLSKVESSKLMVRRGKEEFSGIVIGQVYNLPPPTLFGTIPLLPFLTFNRPKSGLRVQRVTADGNPLDIVEVEVPLFSIVGVVLDRDLVRVTGEWQSSGRFRVSEIENLTSKTRVR